nr:extracellular solute-binding protein [uncultured Gellertiella sp.]
MQRGLGLATGLAFLGFATILPALGADLPWRIGASSAGELRYKPGFPHFDYVNPDAPKGGTVSMAAMGTYDTFNPVLTKGDAPEGLGLVFDTLLKSSDDEITTSYGLLAEGVAYPDDVSFATFRLRKEARWADGQPVTPEDVVYSFDKAKELNIQASRYYGHVVKAEKTGERDVTFRFDQKNNLELPNILGQLTIVPKHWWEGKDAKGNPRDIGRTTLEPVMGSGPYRIAAFQPGSTIRYELRDDYWGKAINVNVGENNFRTRDFTYFGDLDVAFEAFRSGSVNFWTENSAKRWATAYDFPAVQQGRVKREVIPNAYRRQGVMVGFIPNLRRPQFQNEKLRQALNLAFDFEELNRTTFFGQYQRVDSYFHGTELASKDLPQGRELEILTGLKDKLPPSVFTTPFANPVGGKPDLFRNNLRQALALLKEGGYELRGNKTVEAKSGAPVKFEILLNGETLARVALPFAQNLRKIGIDVSVRSVDEAQYTNRVRSFDFDMIYSGWGESLHPGNEQAEFWGSKAASQQGTQNYLGIADPGIDALVDKVIFARDRDELAATTRALDRVLLAHHYVVPGYTLRAERYAYWDLFDRPADMPYYSSGFPDVWWAKAAAK